MLNAPGKNRRRRKRRKKQSTPTTTISSNLDNVEENESNKEHEEILNDRNKSFSPKVNVKFINDDVEIETAMMLKHLTKDSEISKKREYDIKFFMSGLSLEELKDLNKFIKFIDDKLYELDESKESQQTAPEEYPVNGPQLASFYINDDFTKVVEPFEKCPVEVSNAMQLYLPELIMPKEYKVDIESAINDTFNSAEEGHFVKSKPYMWGMNRALFINRLIEESAFQWLDVRNKEIKDIFNIVLSRKLIKTICAEKFRAIDFPPTSITSDFETFSIQDRILKIYLKDITFDKHPLFNDEQIIARELETLYDEYATQKHNNILTNIETKLNVLRQLLYTVSKSASNRSQKSSITENLRIYRDELKEMRSIWHCESAKQRELMKCILEKWTKLKKERENVSVSTTSVKLKIMVQEPDIDKDTYEWNHRFSVEFNEMLQEAMESYREHKLLRKKKVNRNNEAQEQINSEKGKKSDDTKSVRFEKPNANVIEQKLCETFSNSIRPPGEKIIDFELERSGGIQNKNPLKYVVRLTLNNDGLQFPDSSKLNSIGQATFNATYSIKFTTKLPHQLKFSVNVFNEKSIFHDKIIENDCFVVDF